MEVLYQLSYSPARDGHDTSAGRDDLGPVRSPRMTRRRPQPTPDVPRYRYNAALANEIEAKWQDRWEAEHTFWAPNPTARSPSGFDAVARPPQALRARHVPVPERRRAARRPPARLHRHRRLRPLQAHAAATTCCTRWATTRSACRPSSTRSRPASTRASPPRRTSPTCAASCGRSGSATTRGAASPPPTSPTTAGRSGSSCSSSTPGTTTTQDRARPIAELVAELEAGARAPRATPTPTACRGASSTTRTRRAVVDSYRLAYLDEAPVNWCPALGTVLANEEVTADGRSERGNHPVFRRR